MCTMEGTGQLLRQDPDHPTYAQIRAGDNLTMKRHTLENTLVCTWSRYLPLPNPSNAASHLISFLWSSNLHNLFYPHMCSVSNNCFHLTTYIGRSISGILVFYYPQPPSSTLFRKEMYEMLVRPG